MDIKDIIGKKVAVWCRTEQEYRSVIDLIGFEKRKRDRMLIGYVSYQTEVCICLRGGISYGGYSGRDFYIGVGYTILPASDFLQPPPPDQSRRGFDYPY